MGDLYEQSRNLFIRRWGEMGAAWGISRTMAEIHALLFVSTRPLCTDDVMDRLQISRGNASMNLRQLVNWDLIYRVHRPGDRKEYFSGETDVWQMFEAITRERRRREIEPIIETIERCKAMVSDELKRSRGAKSKEVKEYLRRLNETLEFLNLMNAMFNAVVKVGHKNVRRLSAALARLTK